MKQNDGTVTNDRQDILDICADFYQELYSSKNSKGKVHIVFTYQSALLPLTVREVESAINNMKDD